MNNTVTIGLALGGGGAKGMAHIGVLRVLASAQIPIGMIAGTSAGAIVGAFYAAGMSPDEIQKIADSLSVRWLSVDTTGLGVFGTDGVRRMIEKTIGENVNIEDLDLPFMCVAVDLEKQEEVVFDSGPLVDALCATVAYPGIFAPVRVGTRMLFDGGVLNPVPFDILRRYGAKHVVAVDLGTQEPFFGALGEQGQATANPFGQWFYQVSHPGIFRVIDRSLGIMGRRLLHDKLQQAPPDLFIFPQVQTVGLLDFALSETCSSAGEAAAREKLHEIKKLLAQPARQQRNGIWQKAVGWIHGLLGKKGLSDF